MPFKSRAQRRKFAELLVQGKISPETFEEWNRETGGKVLPERAARKPRGKARASAKKRRKSSGRAKKTSWRASGKRTTRRSPRR